MKLTRILEASFFSIAIVLVFLVVGLSCLQGTAGLKLVGFLQCDYGLTSADLPVKVGGLAIFGLFLVLLFGPILAVFVRHGRGRQTKRSGRYWEGE
jgi:uncharacterized membrane protein YhaH (DUF805 family)